MDLVSLVRGMWRRKLLWLAIFLLAVGGAVAILFYSEPRYTAEAVVLIESAESGYTRTQFDEGSRAIDEREVASQEQVIRSRELADQVVERLGLSQNPAFTAVPEELGPVKRYMVDWKLARDPRQVPVDRRVMERYFGGLTVGAIPGAKAVTVGYTSSDPDLAAEVANAVANGYVTYTRTIRSEMTDQARSWLADQIETLRKNVEEAERKVAAYRAENGLLEGSRSLLSTEALSDLSNQIVQAAAARAEAQAKANAIRDMLRTRGTVDASADVMNAPLIQRLTEQRITLKGQLAELSTTYLPDHPRIRSMRQEIADLDEQLRAEAIKIAEGLEQQASIAAAREESLRASLDEMKAEASDSNRAAVELRALERQAESDRALLENMMSRYGDARTRDSAGAQPALARVISPAVPPLNPSFPQPVPVLGLALAGGAILGLVVVFLLEVFSSARTSAPGDGAPPAPPRGGSRLARKTKKPGPSSDKSLEKPAPPMVEEAESRRVEPVLTAGRSDYGIVTEGPRGLLAQLRRWHEDEDVHRVLLTGAPETVTELAPLTLALAREIAGSGIKSVLVDADMRHPKGGLAPGPGDHPGLAELLTGSAAFSQCMICDRETGLHMLTRGQKLRDAHPHLGSGRIELVLDALDQAYRMVLVKAGPLGRPFSGAALAENCQAVAVLMPQGVSESMMAMLARSLAKQGVGRIAFVTVEAVEREALSGTAA